jgi:RND family efflux transporter MFP subunit
MTLQLARVALLLPVLSLAACGKAAPDEAPAPTALVEVQPAATRSLEETLEVYGTLEFTASGASSLPVQVEARVIEVLVTSGTEVHGGQPLLRLAPSPTTRLDFDKARRDAELAVAERERMRRLRKDGLATESELQNAIGAAATAEALRNSLAARVGPGGVLTLSSPRDGIVDALTAQPGDVLAPGTVAVRIAAPDALQVRLGIEPEDLPLIAPGKPVKLTPLNPGAATVSASISAVDRRIDPQTRLAAALIRVPAGSGLLPGGALRGLITTAVHENALTVPRSALLYEDTQAYLFVAANDKVQRREVKTGVQDAAAVEIVDGLKAGEPVVVSGNAALQDGMAIRTSDTKPAAADHKP